MTATSTGERSQDLATTSPHGDVSTRYLCAGAHLDAKFTRDVVRQVLRQPLRAIGPSYGVDTGLVLRHCLSAYRRRLVRDLALAAVAVALLWALLWRPALVIALILVGWGVVLLEAAVVRYEVLGARLHPRRPDLTLPIGWRSRARLAAIERAQSVNVAVYSGYQPFVGSGFDLGAWSFAVDLEKGKSDAGVRRPPKPVDLGVLRDRVLAAVRHTGIDGLSVGDSLFVDGDKVDALPIQPHGAHTRPVGYLAPAVVRQYADTVSTAYRHYHRIQVTAWGGEIVLSIFLAFRIVRGRLYAEANYCLLPPVEHRWHEIDRLRPAPTVGQALKLAGRAVLDLPRALALAVPVLLREAYCVWVKDPLEQSATKAAIRDGAVVDRGTRLTVRSRGASREYWRHFQRLDREMYAKLVEPAILDTVVTVLDESDVDTSDLVERQDMILNQGVLMTGGALRAESLAVGRGAEVTSRSRRE